MRTKENNMGDYLQEVNFDNDGEIDLEEYFYGRRIFSRNIWIPSPHNHSTSHLEDGSEEEIDDINGQWI